tara:strand:- start:1624 stop:1821 length:198 start_codon:yes stop_codon:yes gene_type:complete
MLIAYFCQLVLENRERQLVLDKYWKKFTVLPNNKPEMCVTLYVPDELILIWLMAFAIVMTVKTRK